MFIKESHEEFIVESVVKKIPKNPSEAKALYSKLKSKYKLKDLGSMSKAMNFNSYDRYSQNFEYPNGDRGKIGYAWDSFSFTPRLDQNNEGWNLQDEEALDKINKIFTKSGIDDSAMGYSLFDDLNEDYSGPEINMYGKSKFNFQWLDGDVVVSDGDDATLVYYDPIEMEYDWWEDLKQGDKKDIMKDVKNFMKDYPLPNANKVDSTIHVITKDFHGDMNKWPKGTMVYVMDSEEGKDYKFIKFVNPRYSDNYDDVEASVLKACTEPFNAQKHKRAAKLLQKWKLA